MHTPANCFKCLEPHAANPDWISEFREAHIQPRAEALQSEPPSPEGCLKNLFSDHLLEHPITLLNAIISESERKFPSGLLTSLQNYVPWVYVHSIHVAIISLLLAIHMDYCPSALHDIGLGAFLHDIGKLMIPKAILEKEGPLNQLETIDMRQHCILGIGLIKDSGLPEASTTVILQHHERMDGSGYPYGLEGTRIHRNSKIVMIADVFDALTSHRPYRSAYDKDTALKILGEEAHLFPADVFSTLKASLQ